MGTIKAYMAISLDGYIAHKDGDTNWIPGNLAKEISEIYNTSEILLTGSKTYDAIFEESGYWPYKNTYVVSHYDTSIFTNDNLQFLFDDPLEKVADMKQEVSGDITVIGGGNFITSLINCKLLDELNLYIVPVLLGEGIPLLGKTFDINTKCVYSGLYNGMSKIIHTFN